MGTPKPTTRASRDVLSLESGAWDDLLSHEKADYLVEIEREARQTNPCKATEAALAKARALLTALLDPNLSGLTERSQDYERSVRDQTRDFLARTEPKKES